MRSLSYLNLRQPSKNDWKVEWNPRGIGLSSSLSGEFKLSGFYCTCLLHLCLASSGLSRPDAMLWRERSHCKQPFHRACTSTWYLCQNVKYINGITSSCFAGNAMDLNIQQQDGNENINETIGLISKTTTLHLHHAFLGISLPFLYEIA